MRSGAAGDDLALAGRRRRRACVFIIRHPPEHAEQTSTLCAARRREEHAIQINLIIHTRREQCNASVFFFWCALVAGRIAFAD